MCLGIPGEVVEILADHPDLAKVDVSGVKRAINIGLLEDVKPGDWVLIHVGFAMSKIDEEEARLALASLQMMGGEFTAEVEAFMTSRIETNTRRARMSAKGNVVSGNTNFMLGRSASGNEAAAHPH